jgi:hypothetical protein
MAKPISELAKDLQKVIEDGRAAAGPRIVFSLQKAGPWWTGNFGELWKLSPTPVKPEVSKDRDWQRKGLPGAKNLRPTPALRLPINSPLYIGNAADYAGYAVNDPQAKKQGKTYQEARTGENAMRITAKDGNPRWYKIYTETSRDTGLFLDLDKAFASVSLR